jgi:hypothetical protein
MSNPYNTHEITPKQLELRQITDKLLNHQKSCDTCTKSYVCDIAAEINLKVLELVYSS